MASEKKRRKQRAAGLKDQRAGLPKISKDGDRRHRGGESAKQAVERKRAAQEWNLDAGPSVRILFPDDPAD